MSGDFAVRSPGKPRCQRPLVIGLTGSIASGKSTIAGILRERGAEVIDADAVYRSLLESDRELDGRIIDRFGVSIAGSDGQIDRGTLGAIVFRDAQALRDLEAITHPAVVAEIRRRICRSRSPVVVVEAIKLVQSGLLDDVNQLWHVTADPDVRLKRFTERSGLRENAARERLEALPDPLPAGTRVDVAIDNSGDITVTASTVDRAWRRLGMGRGAGVVEAPPIRGKEDD
jgi:dephospho-CoA kinase